MLLFGMVSSQANMKVVWGDLGDAPLWSGVNKGTIHNGKSYSGKSAPPCKFMASMIIFTALQMPAFPQMASHQFSDAM